MMATQNEWTERGQRVVGAAADLATGLFRGIQNIGPRIQAAQYKPIVEAFCAYTGLMAAQHGRLQTTELDGFRNFLLQNRQHPVFGGFPLDELVDKFKNYAVRAFLNDMEVFVSVLNPIQQNSDAAQLIVAGCMSVIFADGHCDANERRELDQLAQRLGVDTHHVAQTMGVVLPAVQATQSPSPSRTSSFARTVSAPAPVVSTPAVARTVSAPAASPVIATPAVQTPPPVSSGRETCSLCQGKGCVFCNQSGFKS